MLLISGADKNLQDWCGDTALHLASVNGHLEISCLLLQAGADKEMLSRSGHRALSLASAEGHLEIVHLLLEARANKDAENWKLGCPWKRAPSLIPRS